MEVNTTIGSTQVSPQDISVTLTPGRQTRVQCEVGELCELLTFVQKAIIRLRCVCAYQGSEASIVVAVKQLQRYPVDLYYLVDVSASMQENLDHVSVADESCGDCLYLN